MQTKKEIQTKYLYQNKFQEHAEWLFEQNLSPELKKKKFRPYIVKSKYPTVNPTFMPSLISESTTSTILHLSVPPHSIKTERTLLLRFVASAHSTNGLSPLHR